MERLAAIAVIAIAINRFRARQGSSFLFTVEDLMTAAGVVYVAGEFRETARRRITF